MATDKSLPHTSSWDQRHLCSQVHSLAILLLTHPRQPHKIQLAHHTRGSGKGKLWEWVRQARSELSVDTTLGPQRQAGLLSLPGDSCFWTQLDSFLCCPRACKEAIPCFFRLWGSEAWLIAGHPCNFSALGEHVVFPPSNPTHQHHTVRAPFPVPFSPRWI